MPDWLIVFLVLLFFAHWLAFTRLAVLRGLLYYWLLSVLFLFLTSSFLLRLVHPAWEVAGVPLHLLLRYGAWTLAAVTIPMLIARIRRRRS